MYACSQGSMPGDVLIVFFGTLGVNFFLLSMRFVSKEMA